MRRSRFLIAGAVIVGIAVIGPVPALAHRYFWMHMVQHLLLTLVAAPLFALGAPVTSLIKATRGHTRQRVAALAQSRVVAVATHPLFTWTALAAVMWVTHFSPLYDAAVGNPLVHVLEHWLFLAAGVLFWMPVVGGERIARRPLRWPVRLAYLVAALPLQSFLGLAIYSTQRPLYESYPDLSDQRMGALIMWIGGDFVFVLALALVVGGWMRADRRDAAREEARMHGAGG